MKNGVKIFKKFQTPAICKKNAIWLSALTLLNIFLEDSIQQKFFGSYPDYRKRPRWKWTYSKNYIRYHAICGYFYFKIIWKLLQ